MMPSNESFFIIDRHHLAGFILLLALLAGFTQSGSVTAEMPSTDIERLNATDEGCPPTIEFGETILCSIDNPSEVDSYTFTADANDKVLVRMSRTSGNLYAGIRVYDSNGTKLCEDNGSAMAEIASCDLETGGTITILAYNSTSGSNTGDYDLYLQRLNNPAQALSINFGSTLLDSIDSPSEVDSYTFTADANDKILVRMSRAEGGLWPGISVYDSDGNKICEESGTYSAEIASCDLEVGGTVTILAYSSYIGSDTGDYALYLQRLNNPGQALSINFGSTLLDSIDSPSEVDSYTFTADANDKILVRMSRTSGNLYAGLRVYDSNGAKLCENNGSSMAEIASCDLEAGGTVTILAYDSLYGTHIGDYDLYLQRLNNPGQALSINFGSTLLDSIDSPSEVDSYTFTADANDKILVRMSRTSGNLYAGLRVYDSDGNKICEESGTYSAEIASCDLEAGGPVTILAYNSTNNALTGDYDLYLQRLNNPGQTLSINFGSTLLDSIDSPSEVDSYTFTADANDKILVRMSRTSGNLYAGLRVYDSNGTKLCENNGSSMAEIASCDLEAGGTVTILAYNSTNGTNTGDYDLYLQRLNNPGQALSINFGSTLLDSIDSPSEVDSYTFTADANDKILVRMSRTSGNLYAGLRVYDSNGAKLCENNGSSMAEIANCDLEAGGTVTILAYNSTSSALTGDYDLYLQRLNNPAQALSINFGSTLLDSIDSPSEVDSYTFTANANDKILVRMSRAEGGLSPGIRVYDSNGSKLCEEDGPYSVEITSCDLEAGGTVTILAYNSTNGTNTGDYGLYLQRLNNPGQALSINFGATLLDSIDSPSEVDSYTFSADANANVLVRMNRISGNLYAGIRVYDSDGSKLCEKNGINFAEIASCDLGSGGTVTILAYDNSLYGTHTGDYNLSLTCLTPPCGSPSTTPTSTPMPTMSPTVTSTSTPTMSPTVTPTPTVPASQHKIYLPAVLSD